MKEIKKQDILKFEKANESLYKKAIDSTIFSLENSEVFNIYIDAFSQSSEPFKIIDYNFDERLTGLANFDFFNTLSYLNLLGLEKDVQTNLELILKRTNNNTIFIFENFITSIVDAKQKIMFVEDFENQEKDYLTNSYKQFIAIVVNQVSNMFVKGVINLVLEYVDKTDSKELLGKKLDNLNYEFKNIISNQTTSLLNRTLDVIYKEFGLNVKASQKTSESKKIPFSDFNKENHIFEANFDDESIALRILGLGQKATQIQIKKAYKELALKYHPDRNHSAFAVEQMKKINNAYNLLKKHFS